MGKTKQRKFTLNDDSFVNLLIRGPPSIIGHDPKSVKVRVTTTWLSLLRDTLNLKLPLNRGLYIFSRYKGRYCLNDTVRNCVNCYSHVKKERYVVHLRYPTRSGNRPRKNNGANLKRVKKAPSQKRVEMPPPPPPPMAVPSSSRGLRASIVNPFPTPRTPVSSIPSPQGSVTSFATPRIDDVRSLVSWNSEAYPVAASEGDSVSVFTTISFEEEELRRLNIRVENLKPDVMNRCGQYDNATLLRMKREIRTNMQNGTWRRLVKRFSLCSSFLVDVLGLLNENN